MSATTHAQKNAPDKKSKVITRCMMCGGNKRAHTHWYKTRRSRAINNVNNKHNWRHRWTANNEGSFRWLAMQFRIMIVSPRWVCKHPRPRLTPSVDRLTRSSYNHIRNNRQIMYIIFKKHTHTIKTVKSVETRNKNCFKIKFMCRLFLSSRHSGTAEPRSTWKMVVKTERDCFFVCLAINCLQTYGRTFTSFGIFSARWLCTAPLKWLCVIYGTLTNWIFYITLHYSIRNQSAILQSAILL